MNARSLVVAEQQDGVARYRLLESIRQYAQERLAEAGEVAMMRERHLEWFHDLALRAEPELTGPAQAAWLDRLDADHANFRLALAWAGENEASTLGLRLATALWRFWYTRGELREGRAWLEAVLLHCRLRCGQHAPLDAGVRSLGGDLLEAA